ncbi:PIN-like domain-containing protein [Paenibacillus sp. ISL-20]|uniref:PIN-like domain-containing protein n=1 Tax=Paenibacillus sp. ISL-20 TaxID=2819163 RepID=UPI001BE8ABDA|nr:PIN-like domain-containing protein [Paenibacillus sp. ISL-20]MBT2764299.1 DUF4935 domain-containing protein [Paenibacillus sp. ISL-20]
MNKDAFVNIGSDSIIILDTSAILDIFRYSITSSKRILLFLKQYADFIWIPAQVKDEVLRNIGTVKSEHINKYKNLSKILVREVENLHNTLQSKMVNYKKYNFSGIDTIEEKFKHKFDELKKTIHDYKNELVEEEEVYKDFILKEAESFVLSILESEQVGEAFNIAELLEIIKEGELRYRYNIPPGYQDQETKEGIRKFGDLILWKQLLKKAETTDKEIFFILSDTKEDWFVKDDIGSNESVRAELMQEFFHITNRKNLYITSMSNFIDTINSDSDKDLLVDLRKERLLNRISIDKYNEILYECIETIDGDDLIDYLSNAIKYKIDDVELMGIDDLKINEISVQNKERVYVYNVIINFVTRFDCNSHYDTHSSNGTIVCDTSCNISLVRNQDSSEKEFLETLLENSENVFRINSLTFKNEEYIWSGDSDPVRKIRTYQRIYQQSPYTTCPLCNEDIDILNDAGNGFCTSCSRTKDI